MMKQLLMIWVLVVAQVAVAAPFGQLPKNATHGDRMFAEYFKTETEKLSKRSLAEIKTIEDWSGHKTEYRRQLAEMLGLDPMPARTDLKPVITGKIDHPDFIVEKLTFQTFSANTNSP